jgi:hypothetical protein
VQRGAPACCGEDGLTEQDEQREEAERLGDAPPVDDHAADERQHNVG